MNLSDFDYELPESFIAQQPIEPRDASRLLVLNRQSGAIEHGIFRDITAYLDPGDVLVLNNTRVIPARLRAVKSTTGGAVELLLLRQLDAARWQVLAGGRRVKTGTRLIFPNTAITAEVLEELADSERIIAFSQPVEHLLAELGQTPLPPYIHTPLKDQERYQTVYNQHAGSAAAPTAGLHFTHDLLAEIQRRGILLSYCTLHIGLDTFQPVRVEQIEQHPIHSELAILTEDNARIINGARRAGRRIIAVGTTSARTLETAAVLAAGGQPAAPRAAPAGDPLAPVTAFERNTDLFIYPGYQWRAVDALITNFHLPESTLIMMISAFAGRETILNAYEVAKREGYRFYSFGDAMFII